MLAFASKPKTSSVPAHAGPSLASHAAVAVSQHDSTPESNTFSMDNEIRLPHDLSRIPVFASAIQCKLPVSVPGDPLEREADAVADRIMRMQDSSPMNSAPPMIQRKCEKCEEEEEKQAVEGKEDESLDTERSVILRKAAQSSTVVPAPVASHRLAAGPGVPLELAARLRMENSFGRDFSGVRVHHDREAGAMSRQLSALAFTYGRHIYFREDMYRPDLPAGRRLLAHELAHVIQQGHAPREIRAGQKGGTDVVRTAAPVIQRTATFSGATLHQSNNLADVFLFGNDVGVTVQQLNGTALSSTADARGALVRPTLAFASAASGGVNASVASVPTNTGSADERVLAPGPWTHVVPKTTVGAAFPALTACSGTGNSTFRAKGRPSDAAMFAANRRHEDHHVTDHTNVFNTTVGAWDTRLTAAQSAGTNFNGATQAAAEAALHAAMGGTPDQIADALFNNRRAAAAAFHATPGGGPVTTENPTANSTCTTSEVTSFNPS